ncbi:MAG: tetratricopeptide repeat protein [Taibaiella sp.]|nr:tetratricopeptide repeat protein [Taibaiella sp.]
MKKSIFITVLVLLHCIPLQAQNKAQHRIDSLESVLPHSKEDTNKVAVLLSLAFEYGNVNPETGIRYGREGLALATKLGNKRGIARAHNNLGSCYEGIAEYEQSAEHYYKALELYEQLGRRVAISSVLCNVAAVHMHTNDYKRALECATRALAISEQDGDKEGMGSAAEAMGNAYRSLGDYPKAMEYDRKALKAYQEAGDTWGEAVASMYIGGVYASQGDYATAVEWFFKALKLYDQLGNKHAVAECLQNIAEFNSSMQNYSKGIEYALQSLKISKETGSKNIEAGCYATLGQTYFMMNDTAQGLAYMLKGLKLSQEIKVPDKIAGFSGLISNVYTAQKNYVMAITYGLYAFKINKELGMKRNTATSLYYLGSAYLGLSKNGGRLSSSINISPEQTGSNNIPVVSIPASKGEQLKLSISYFEQGLAIAEEIQALDIREICDRDVAEAYALTGNSSAALAHFHSYMKAHDSLYNQEKNRDITRNEMKYVYEKREDSIRYRSQADLQAQQFKMQRQRILLIAASGIFVVIIVLIVFIQRSRVARAKAKQEALFSRQLLEIELKALRAQMNPHFIFNCLNSIQAFILKENRIDATEYLQKFSRLIRLILDNSQKTSNTIQDEAEILDLYLNLERLRLKDRFDFEIKIGEDIDQSFTEIPSMVIQPLVENSIWHGFVRTEQGGMLLVEFKKHDNKLIITVEDNGIGRPQSKVLKEQKGTSHQSKGMKLIEDRLKAWSQTQGLAYEFKIYDNIQDEKGTRIEISILYSAEA